MTSKKILEFLKFLVDRNKNSMHKRVFSTILPGLKKGNWHSSSPAKDEITFCAIARPVAFEIRQEERYHKTKLQCTYKNEIFLSSHLDSTRNRLSYKTQ